MVTSCFEVLRVAVDQLFWYDRSVCLFHFFSFYIRLVARFSARIYLKLNKTKYCRHEIDSLNRGGLSSDLSSSSSKFLKNDNKEENLMKNESYNLRVRLFLSEYLPISSLIPLAPVVVALINPVCDPELKFITSDSRLHRKLEFMTPTVPFLQQLNYFHVVMWQNLSPLTEQMIVPLRNSRNPLVHHVHFITFTFFLTFKDDLRFHYSIKIKQT